MVIFIPNESIDKNNFNGSYGERRLYEEFQKLSDEYIVFHSLNWKKEKSNSILTGEADFLVFHKKYGFLSIEVKHGGISGRNGIIYQINRNTLRENAIQPMMQADKSKYTIIEILNNLNLDSKDKYYVSSLVWFTGVNKSNLIGDLPLSYIKDVNTYFEDHLNNIEKSLLNAYKSNHHIKKEQNSKVIKQTINAIAPEFSLFQSMNNLINQNNYYFNMMTNEQAYLLDYLEEQTTAVIQGGAGTGKTMLAVEKARRLSVNGEKVLFLCFNSLLIQSLQQKYKNELSNVYFSNLNSIVSKALNKKANNDDIIQFLRNIEDYKIWDYKHIIIDEGQDFLDETVLLLKDYSILVDGVFYVFYDKNQLVQRRDNLKWLNDMECRLVLNKNCRNTKNIAKTSFKPLGIDDFKMKLEILGDKPIYHNSKTKEETLLWLENRIKMYLKNDVKKNQIVILTVKTLETSILKNTNKIGNLKISNNFDDKNILFTTARKYKGLEADVIIIIDLDYSTFNKEENKRLFYVASSRAKNHLELNSQLNEEELEKLFLVVSNGRTKKINALIGDLKVSIR
ncbi:MULTISPECIES: nuclease-related domain-containing DEAD/DEAH box helicase [Staphylococcus]|uniref:AAA family ATPase n=2 Tax=Bacillales TaxID=1385 RepID=A0A3S7GWA8_STAHO|nr:MULTISPECIES: NERD domain-containing protein/DEAD/DEAH box helicase [Staphylococcus]EUZ69182.1 hypothetical protein O552_00939 [Staphylococcus sp. M0480]OHO56389.1 hypothetical protein HMPREF2650_01450 [Staphylococcus sp. HMSC035F02]AVI06558.1 hypothetical protein AZE34_07225 [Staphylococcus hominis]MBC2909504.1 ATP-binding domain-containing protein [Staphylococcus hominis]MBC2911782.1 ATP-binding domain-containing protein [Staphylococcus hominis]